MYPTRLVIAAALSCTLLACGELVSPVSRAPAVGGRDTLQRAPVPAPLSATKRPDADKKASNYAIGW